jgi:exopolysaccharide biosynthesis polyprenyl glycosylphosphotransferase
MNIQRQRFKYICSDLVATALGWFVFYLYRYDLTGHLSHPTLGQFLTDGRVETNLLLSPWVWVAIFAFSGYYQQAYFKSYVEELQTTLSSIFFGSLLFFFSMVIDDIPLVNDDWFALIKTPRVSPRVYLQIVLTMYGCVFLPVYLGRYFITHHTNSAISSGRLGLRTLIVGNGRAAAALLKELAGQKRSNGYTVVGCVTCDSSPRSGNCQAPVLGDFADVRCLLTDHDIEAVILAPDHRDRKVIYKQIYTLLPYGCPILLRAHEQEFIEGGLRSRSLTALPMLKFGVDCMPPFRRNLKRASDIVVALVALVLLSPVLLVLSVMTLLDSPGPIFYSQERIGRLGRPFRMYKFRSMRVDAELSGPQLSKTDDPRITKLGHVLRKYRLDELPQFWNVLRGDMSLVGPRPERAYYIERIMETAPQYSLLLQLRPGITSWGMVKYGYAGDVFQMIERMRYDLMYLGDCTIPMDLKIIGYTIRTVITGKGI